MKKYFPVILVAAILTLSACGVKTGENNNIDKNNTVTGEDQRSEKKSLKDLLGLNSSQKCTYESNEDGERIKGEIIINGKKFKQSVEITTKEGTTKIYSVSDGTYYYSWGDAMKGSGTKMKMTDLEEQTGKDENVQENNKTEKQEVNIDQEVDYKCSPATLSESDLALPKEVKFVDYTEMMKGLQSGNLEDLKKLVPSQEE